MCPINSLFEQPIETPWPPLPTLIDINKTWISNHLWSKVWTENTYSIPTHQWLHRWSLGMDNTFFPILHNGWNYLSTPGLKWIHVNERGPRRMIFYDAIHLGGVYWSPVWLMESSLSNNIYWYVTVEHCSVHYLLLYNGWPCNCGC